LSYGKRRAITATVVDENETLRWPTNLNRGGIEQRLLLVRAAAESQKLSELSAIFRNLEAMTPGEIGSAVVSALSWLQDKPEHRPITMQLEMVAMNLKNLK
jgi:hypothetical protein